MHMRQPSSVMKDLKLVRQPSNPKMTGRKMQRNHLQARRERENTRATASRLNVVDPTC